MDEEEIRDNLEAMHDSVTRLQLLEAMAEDIRLERGDCLIYGEQNSPCGYGFVNTSSQVCLTLPQIWGEIASIYD